MRTYSSRLHVDSYNGSHSWFSLFLTDKFSWLSQHFFIFQYVLVSYLTNVTNTKIYVTNYTIQLRIREILKIKIQKFSDFSLTRKCTPGFPFSLGTVLLVTYAWSRGKNLKQMCRLGGAIMAPELVTRFSWIRDCDNWHINPTFQSYQPFVYWHLCWTRTTTITIPLVFSLLHILLVVTDRIKPKHLTTAEFQFMNPLHQFSIN